MTRLAARAGRLLAMLLPWPARSARHAAIMAARKQKERSQAGAARADSVRREIESLAAQNHFAASIAQMIARHGGEGA